jgi:hypothetical protein
MASERKLWIEYSRENLVKQGTRSFPFIPGVLFLGLGLLVIAAPRLVIVALAGILLFLGALFCFVAWKFIQLKNRFAAMTRDLEGKIQVQAFQVRPRPETSVETDSKKIVYH